MLGLFDSTFLLEPGALDLGDMSKISMQKKKESQDLS